MNHAEDAECINLMQWVALHLKKYPDLAELFHIPNGGKRGLREAARFKAMGVAPGIPDYFLPIARDMCYGLWIEMKRPQRDRQRKGSLSAVQADRIDRLTKAGYLCVVCWGWESARDTLVGYLGDT